jgi:DNA topoisomerase-1
MELFRLPRNLGNYGDQEVIVSAGRFGPYVKHGTAFYSLAKTDDPLEIGLERAVEIILEKKKEEKGKIIREYDEEPELRVLNGKYGAYISFKKQNFKIPKGKKAEELTYDDCRKIVSETEPTKPAKGKRKK